MTPTKDEIKAWLTSSGKDREWLASKLETTKSVVDSWFSSRGFPSERLSAISALMKPEEDTSHIRIPFTDDQLRIANQAASIVSSDFQEFCAKALQHRAEEIIRDKASSNVIDPAEVSKDEPKNGGEASTGTD